MKILYFHQHFTIPKNSGGTRSYEFARKLIQRGHDVTMVCGMTTDLNLKSTSINGINRGEVDGIDVIQIDLPYSNNDGIFKRAVTFVRFSWKGIRISLKEDYDLLFATSTPLTAGIPGIFMKWFGKNKRKFVFEVRDLWPELPKALGMKNPFLLKGMAILEKLTYKKADAVIGLSPGICEGIKRVAPAGTPIRMISNGCDVDLFKPKSRKELALKGISENDVVGIFTGAHGIANGLDAVLDMAAELKKRNREDIKLVFIGDGKLKKGLVERAEREGLTNCLFFDPVPKTTLKEILPCVDIGMMVLKNVPAFYYGTSPNKFFDYIASGIPVVNNYPGWIADLITENSCGELAEPNEAISFANAMEKLADDKELRIKLGRNGRALAEKEFTRDDLSEKFTMFLEQMHNNKVNV